MRFLDRHIILCGYLCLAFVGLFYFLAFPHLVPNAVQADFLLSGVNDSRIFHLEGKELASHARLNGISVFFHPFTTHFPSVVSGLIYYLTGLEEIYVFYPLTSFVYVLSCYLWYRILKTQFSTGSSICAFIIILMMPSSSVWYLQHHKELYLFLGLSLLTTFVFTKFSYRLFPLFIVGYWLIMVSKGYLGILIASLVLIAFFVHQKLRDIPKIIGVCLMIVLTCLTIREPPAQLEMELIKKQACQVSSTIIPASIIQRIENVRTRFLIRHDRAASDIDIDQHFCNDWQFISYLPRAIAIGFFYPLPIQHWGDEVNSSSRSLIERSISRLEMSIVFISWVFVAFFLRKRVKYWLPVLIISVPVILLIVYANPNMGTLYRYRGPYLLPLIAIGLAEGVAVLSKRFGVKL